MGCIVGVQVIREAGDAEPAEYLRAGRGREVDHKERVDPFVRHHVEPVADEPGRVDLFLAGNVGQGPNRLHPGVQHEDIVVLVRALHRVHVRSRGDPEVAVVLVHSELVLEAAGYFTPGNVGDGAVADRDLVDGGCSLVDLLLCDRLLFGVLHLLDIRLLVCLAHLVEVLVEYRRGNTG